MPSLGECKVQFSVSRGFLRERKLQQEYYERTASCYDAMHVADGDEHYVSLSYISVFTKHLSVKNVPDVGAVQVEG
jgi:hypothetical protein